MYPKRSESTLLNECLRYLHVLENLGRIAHVDRLNSGSVIAGNRRVRLCRKGTPDILVVGMDGHVYWLEAKTNTGKQLDSQIEFEQKIKYIPNQHYFIIRDADQITHIFPDEKAY